MKNYIQAGNTITATNGGETTIDSGTAVLVGTIVGVALNDIAPGGSGPAATEGVFTLPKVAGVPVTQGAALSWDVSEAALTADTAAEGDVTGVAVAWSAAGASDTAVVAKIGSVGRIEPAVTP